MTVDLTDEEVDFETAVGDPAAYYANPQAIVADTTLSRPQKLRFLTEWAQDLADRQVADGEGMAPEGAKSAHDAALLKQVNSALALVEAESDVETAVPRTFWTRLKAILG